MNIVVTGGCGFLGQHLVRRLVADGHHVEVIDTAPRVVGPSVDVRDTKAVTRMILGFDVVVHLAAMNAATQTFYDRPEEVLDVGARGTLSMIDAARAAGVRDFVFASSSEVLGEPSAFPTPETAVLKIADPSNPRFSYAASKILGESAVLNATGFRKVQVFRPFNLYGEGQARGHVIPDLIAMAGFDGPITVQGDREQSRSFCHVSDAVEGIVLMMRDGGDGVFHIGNDCETTVRELVEMIAPGREIVAGARPAGSPRRRQPDISKMRALGYESRVSLEAGLARLLG